MTYHFTIHAKKGSMTHILSGTWDVTTKGKDPGLAEIAARVLQALAKEHNLIDHDSFVYRFRKPRQSKKTSAKKNPKS
jgi:hypothetical protein